MCSRGGLSCQRTKEDCNRPSPRTVCGRVQGALSTWDTRQMRQASGDGGVMLSRCSRAENTSPADVPDQIHGGILTAETLLLLSKSLSKGVDCLHLKTKCCGIYNRRVAVTAQRPKEAGTVLWGYPAPVWRRGRSPGTESGPASVHRP